MSSDIPLRDRYTEAEQLVIAFQHTLRKPPERSVIDTVVGNIMDACYLLNTNVSAYFYFWAVCVLTNQEKLVRYWRKG